jgi:hypothetical protein
VLDLAEIEQVRIAPRVVWRVDTQVFAGAASIPLQVTCSRLVPAAGQRSWETRPVQTHCWQVAPSMQPGDFRA